MSRKAPPLVSLGERCVTSPKKAAEETNPTTETFENGGFTLKAHQMSPVYTAPEEFRNATITGHFGFVFKKNSVREIT